MRPNFDYYMASLDGWPFEVGVDLSLRERVPIDGLSHRLHVRLNLNHPSDDGLSTKEEDALLAAIEEEAVQALDKNDYCLVAAVTHRKARTLVFYARYAKDATDVIHQILERAQTHASEVMEEEDPEWTEYLEVLYPQEEMLHQILDRKVLKEFDRQGDDPSRIHAIDACFGGLTEEGAKLATELLEKEAFKVVDVTRAEKGGDANITLTARVESPLGLAIIDDFRHTWLEIAGRAKGTYRGWSADVMPVSGKNNDHGLDGHINDYPDPIAEDFDEDPKSVS